jgi:hypothetical protein
MPVAGLFGHAVARAFGKDPKSEMDEDLARFKSRIEGGHLATTLHGACHRRGRGIVAAAGRATTLTRPRMGGRVENGLQPLQGERGDYDRLLERSGDARFVLLGEASHGTHEFYRERAEITRRPHRREGLQRRGRRGRLARRVPREPVRPRRSGDPDARSALLGFERFPAWMWRNEVVLEFVEWLRAHNERAARGASRSGSTASTSTASSARSRWCWSTWTRSIRTRPPRALPLRVLRPLRRGLAGLRLCRHHRHGPTCEDAVVKQLHDLRMRAFDYARMTARRSSPPSRTPAW